MEMWIPATMTIKTGIWSGRTRHTLTNCGIKYSAIISPPISLTAACHSLGRSTLRRWNNCHRNQVSTLQNPDWLNLWEKCYTNYSHLIRKSRIISELIDRLAAHFANQQPLRPSVSACAEALCTVCQNGKNKYIEWKGIYLVPNRRNRWLSLWWNKSRNRQRNPSPPRGAVDQRRMLKTGRENKRQPMRRVTFCQMLNRDRLWSILQWKGWSVLFFFHDFRQWIVYAFRLGICCAYASIDYTRWLVWGSYPAAAVTGDELVKEIFFWVSFVLKQRILPLDNYIYCFKWMWARY